MSSRGIVVRVVGRFSMVQALTVLRQGRGPGCLVVQPHQSGSSERRTICSCSYLDGLYSPGGAGSPFSPIPQAPQSTALSALMALENRVSPYYSPISAGWSAIQDSRPFQHRVWRNLSGKERQWISWKKSAHAVVFSSCQSSFDVQPGYMREFSTHFSQCRAEYFARLRSSCLGIPLS